MLAIRNTTKSSQTRSKNVVKGIASYPREDKLSMPKRIAHCLDWCAREFPNQIVPFQMLLKAVMGYERTPKSDSKEIDQLRKRWTVVRKILIKDYSRDLHVERGMGARATDGSEDVARHTLGIKVRRFNGAKKSVEQTLAIIDSKNIKDKSLRSWVDGLTPAFKALSAPDFEKKLLPPKE